LVIKDITTIAVAMSDEATHRDSGQRRDARILAAAAA
jgi:hypothetical protein